MKAVSSPPIDSFYKLIIRTIGGDLKHLIKALVGKRLITYRNLLWEVRPVDNFTDYALWLNKKTREESELQQLADLFSSQDIIGVDIGANIGLYSIYASSIAGKNSHFLAFEPNPNMRKRLIKNIELNNISNIEVFPYAISTHSGEMDLNFPSKWNSGEASLVQASKKRNKAIKVPVRSLVDILPSRDVQIDFIKVDIEGAEDSALLPYLRSISTEVLPRYILMEHSHSHLWKEDLEKVLLETGYSEYSRTANNVIYQSPNTRLD